MMKSWMVPGKEEAVTGSVYYDSDGICNIFDGKDWIKLFAWSGQNRGKSRVSRIDSIFGNIRKNKQ